MGNDLVLEKCWISYCPLMQATLVLGIHQVGTEAEGQGLDG